jgi:hypothetical protein
VAFTALIYILTVILLFILPHLRILLYTYYRAIFEKFSEKLIFS